MPKKSEQKYSAGPISVESWQRKQNLPIHITWEDVVIAGLDWLENHKSKPQEAQK